MDNVPYDIAPFLLHKNEIVLSAPIADMIRNMSGVRGGGGSSLPSTPDRTGRLRSEEQVRVITEPDSVCRARCRPWSELVFKRVQVANAAAYAANATLRGDRKGGEQLRPIPSHNRC